ncbi:MAG: hypothetical protein M4579_004019 [Chaenotheca gracillima]|nr:MAG: hypothetical protein M4579_004019 [Chaenotheca gracillima]
MAEKYKEFLAANLLSEGRIVTYRSLSRALKVHVNKAKQMLYEFHRQQNTKKPKSLYATYLLSGTRYLTESSITNGKPTIDGEDEIMQSSPFMSSSMQNQEDERQSTPVHTVTLVREEDLENVKALYERIDSIHIYSLQPQSLKIASTYANEDPLAVGQTYGTIQNPNVKRRTGRRPPPTMHPRTATAGTAKPLSTKSKVDSKDDSSNSTPISTQQEGFIEDSKSSKESLERPKNVQNTKKPQMKRDSSDIFKSFAKTRPQPKRQSAGMTGSQSGEKTPGEDEPMKEASEDEQEQDIAMLKSKSDRDNGKQSKSQREEQLKQMMEQEDEPMEDEPSQPAEDSQDSANPIDAPMETEPETSQQPTVAISGGRRRGRRKVTKKKTVKDEEGYLVTRDEPTWESFSESETELPRKAKPAASTAPANLETAAKAKKAGTKPGQGNIMSFFSKK